MKVTLPPMRKFRRNIDLLKKGGRHGASIKAKRRSDKIALRKEIYS